MLARTHRWAAGLFLYQTFDAIDGCVSGSGLRRSDVGLTDGGRLGAWETGRKQARRTGMAGPLGEMFDHGAF